jgi:tryptophanyl-tRNA synthetase
MQVLTGIQPTNILHIGNLFGALLPAVALQKEHDLVMMVVDYHAITVDQAPKLLQENILFTAATYLAAGIDPKKTILFQQSSVSAHTELAWILQTRARMGELQRMTQYKDKTKKSEDLSSVGLFTYPVLMAADILLFNTEVVPVGEDQKQHVELTRDLAERFNRDFGETFVVPQPVIGKSGARIKALNDPEKKMSKSAASAKNYISLMDSEDVIAKKIRSAVTDSQPGITVDDTRHGLKNLLSIYSLISNETMAEIAEKYNNRGIKDFKDDLAELLIMYLNPLQTEINSWLDNKDELIKLLAVGGSAANEIAQIKLNKVKKKIGVLL